MYKFYLLSLFVLLVGTMAFAEHGFFNDTWQAKSYTPPETTSNIDAETGTPDVTVSVAAADTLTKILPSLFGNNTNAWIRSEINTNDTALRHLRNANIHTLRLPGGNWSNLWLWDGEIHWALKENYEEDIRSRPTTNWTQTGNEMIELARLIGAEAQICVNYSLARYIDEVDPVQKAAQYAADWVYDVNVDQGLNVKYWEVGNENYGQWQSGFEVEGVQITGTEYGRDFCIFVDSMKAVDPTIKIGAVLYESPTGSNVKNWTQEVLAEVKDHADYLVVHDYFTWASDLNDVTVRQVLNGLDKIKKDMDNVETMVAQYTGKPKEFYPVAMTEYNMRAGRKNNSFLCTVYIAQALGEMTKQGFALANYWDIANGYNENNGDHGLLSRNDADVADYTPHPSFYAFYYYSQCFGDVLVSAQSDDDEVAVYASRFANDYLGLLLVNEATEPKKVAILSDGFPTGNSRLFRYELAAEELTSFNFTINGESSSQGKFGPEHYEDILPLEQTAGDNPVLTVAGTSLNFLVIEQGVDTKVKTLSPPDDFYFNVQAYPNPFNPSTMIQFVLKSADHVALGLYNIRGEHVRTLTSGFYAPGKHQVLLDGSTLSSGLYVIRMNTSNHSIKRNISLIR